MYIDNYLSLRYSKESLPLLGKLLVDGKYQSLWDYDTTVLPRKVRKWRKKAKAFSRLYIRPLAPVVDNNPYDFDPQPLIKEATRWGFQTIIMPFPFGSAALMPYLRSTTLQVAVIAEEFATECGGLALLLLAHHLGVAPLLLSGHIPTWLKFLLPMYIKGAWFAKPTTMAFAITEPEAGSDVEDSIGAKDAHIQVTATPVNGGYLLNGTKVFISDGAIADQVTVFAKIKGEEVDSWTCFLVKKCMKGFSAGRREKKMGQRAADASELIFDNVFVPRRNIVGKLRGGWALNQNVLNYSRPVVAAMALGHARGAFERALHFCNHNYYMGKKLIDYKEIQYELADMLIKLESVRMTIWRSCAHFRACQSLSSIAKVYASDMAVEICKQAMAIMGDAGIYHEYGVEKALRDARLTQIYEGTNQINRYAIIEHQYTTDVAIDTI
ncbi:MAG: acyl-CoA dehydrogenase family protein [Spirochaetota bacterium]|nr:acyl-CoA dehydrogenase family protein [Spirochaetota bacterium]